MLKLRYYQKDAVDKFFQYTEDNWGKHPVIVLPTGAGKSLVQAYIVKHMLDYTGTRILLVTHQQYLIQQNYSELIDNFDNDMFLNVGIHSAGLKSRDTSNRILFAGIQSVYKKAWHLGFFDLVLIDEAHMIPHSGEGMYRTFLQEMIKINPKVVIGGLSATPYRLKHGLLMEGEGALFDAICHETSVKELIEPTHYKNRDKKQYLCNLISKNGINKVDLSGVHIRGGEYVADEMEKAFKKDDLVCRAVQEIKELTSDRKKILIFTAGISHCEEVTEKLNSIGLAANCTHSKRSDETNKEVISNFKNGDFKYLVNVNSLTTGFNEKGIDCIVLLRSTMSPGLYYQMVGRGFRMHPDKNDCLILDFGGNINYHGPVDKIEIRRKKDGTGHEIHTIPQKECPDCHLLVSIQTMECPNCQYKFSSKDKHDDTASEADIISKWKKPQTIDVTYIKFSRHQKIGKPDSLRVDYGTGMYEHYSEWVCLEHTEFAKRKADAWVRKRTDKSIKTVQDALDNETNFRRAEKIVIDINDKFPKIVGYVFEDEEEFKKRIKREKREAYEKELDDLASVL